MIVLSGADLFTSNVMFMVRISTGHPRFDRPSPTPLCWVDADW